MKPFNENICIISDSIWLYVSGKFIFRLNRFSKEEKIIHRIRTIDFLASRFSFLSTFPFVTKKEEFPEKKRWKIINFRRFATITEANIQIETETDRVETKQEWIEKNTRESSHQLSTHLFWLINNWRDNKHFEPEIDLFPTK